MVISPVSIFPRLPLLTPFFPSSCTSYVYVMIMIISFDPGECFLSFVAAVLFVW